MVARLRVMVFLAGLNSRQFLATPLSAMRFLTEQFNRFYLKKLSHFNEIILFEILPASLELSHVSVDMIFRIENFDV